MPKLQKKAPDTKSKSNICTATVKWFGDDGKTFGFLCRADGEDLFLHQNQVEEAQNSGVFTGDLLEGDTLEVSFEEEWKGLAVTTIHKHERSPEVLGHVVGLAKDGHAFIKAEGYERNVFCFVGLVKQAELGLGDEVMMTVIERDRGPKAPRVRKTGRKVDLAPPAKKSDAKKLKTTKKHHGDGKKSAAALYTDVYGFVKSYNKDKGFGFIIIDPEAKLGSIGLDVFVCYKAVEKASGLPEQTLYEQDVLKFDIYPGREAGKYEARNLRYLETSATESAEEPTATADLFDQSQVAAE